MRLFIMVIVLLLAACSKKEVQPIQTPLPTTSLMSKIEFDAFKEKAHKYANVAALKIAEEYKGEIDKAYDALNIRVTTYMGTDKVKQWEATYSANSADEYTQCLIANPGQSADYCERHGHQGFDAIIWYSINSACGDYQDKIAAKTQRDFLSSLKEYDAVVVRKDFKENEVRAAKRYTEPFRVKGSVSSISLSLGKPIVVLDAGDGNRLIISGLKDQEVESLNKFDVIDLSVEKAHELFGTIYVDALIINKNYLLPKHS